MSLAFRVAGAILGVVILLSGVVNIFVGSTNLLLRGLFTASWFVMGVVLLRYARRPRRPGKEEDASK